MTTKSGGMRLLDLFNARPVITAEKSSHDLSIRQLWSAMTTMLSDARTLGSVRYDQQAQRLVTETAHDLPLPDATEEPNDPTDWKIRFVHVATDNTNLTPHLNVRMEEAQMALAR